MTGEDRVYELDTDAMIAGLTKALDDRGYEVVEQVPAGIWWVRTDRDRAGFLADVKAALTGLLDSCVTDIRQDEEG